MLDQDHTQIGPDLRSEEYVTIIGPNMADVMRQFRAQHLDEEGYAITGRIDRHRFEMADATGVHDLFDGAPMLAATFVRSVAA